MQIKHYSILDIADLDIIKSWAEQPQNHCYLIAQGRAGEVTHSLCVYQAPGMTGVFEQTESALAGKIAETTWPE